MLSKQPTNLQLHPILQPTSRSLSGSTTSSVWKQWVYNSRALAWKAISILTNSRSTLFMSLIFLLSKLSTCCSRVCWLRDASRLAFCSSDSACSSTQIFSLLSLTPFFLLLSFSLPLSISFSPFSLSLSHSVCLSHFFPLSLSLSLFPPPPPPPLSLSLYLPLSRCSSCSLFFFFFFWSNIAASQIKWKEL